MTAQVIVVGAGPGGSAAAHALARAGVEVTVLERARLPREKVCAEFLGPGTLREVVRLLGEPPEALIARPLRGFRISTSSGAAFDGYYPAPGAAVARSQLDTWLAAAAARSGADLCEGVRVLGIERQRRGWGLRAQDRGTERRIEAQAIVAADGLHSTIAARLGVRRTRRAPRRIALAAHMEVAGLGDVGEMHTRPGAYCGVAPLSGAHPSEANVALVVDQSEAKRLRGDTETYLRTALDGFEGLSGRIGAITRPVLATGPMSVGSAPAPAGVFLVGDAAAFLDPFTGQGIGRAIRSGTFAAAAAVAYLDGDRGATRTFERRCEAAFRGERAVERLVQSFLAHPSLFERTVRRLEQRPSLADTLVGVTGDIIPSRRVLNPAFLARLLT